MPSVSTYGGEMIVENGYAEPIEPLDLETQSVSWVGDGTEQNPYQINQLNVTDAYNKINNISSSNKYFILAEDIDLSGWTISNFHDSALGSAAYLFSAEGSNPSSVHFKIDGNGHKIYSSTNSLIDASGYEYFALFGFMNEYCEVSNLLIENISVNLTNAAAGSVVAFKNEGTINNVTVSGCSVTVLGSTANTDLNSGDVDYSYLDNNSNTGNDIYPGFAAVAADNRGVVRDSSVADFRITVNNGSHYIGGIVGQNRGVIGGVLLSSSPATYSAGCSVSGLKITATAANAYVGGVCAYNAGEYDNATPTVRNAVVDLVGSSNITNNIYGGRYVGGLIGLNDGVLANALVEGSFGTVSTPSADAYDMCGVVRSDDESAASYVPYYYGGAVAGGSGSIANVTVQNLGFFMSLVSTDQHCYFGGIAATASTQNAVTGCVSTGSFVSSDYSALCYAGGILAYAPANAAASTLSNCYTLFRLQNKEHYLNGAVVGFGGNASMASNCYWSSEISGCVTAYAIPNANDAGMIEGISDRSKDLTDSGRATVARRNATLTGLAQPTHSWSGSSASISGEASVPDHLVQGVVNTLDAAPYQQTLTLPSGVGYSGRASFAVDFKLDIFIVASDTDAGDPNDPSDPFKIASSGMIRFLYLAPYANFVLTQDVTIDENEWEPVAFYGRLYGTDANSVTHAVYAPRRMFSAVVGQRASGVTVTTDGDSCSTTPGSVTIDGGLIDQLNVILTPDYFVLPAGAYNESVFGSLFSATLRTVSLTNDTSLPVKLSGTRQGVLADAAYRNTYLYGCSTTVSMECNGTCEDVGALIGRLDSSNNVVDNCVIDADVTLATGASVTNASAFIGNIASNGGVVVNSVVVTTVASGVAAVFGAAGTGATIAARGFGNIFWARNSDSETSVPISDSRASFDGLVLWGTSSNDQTLAQYYDCSHVLNSGDAVIELSLPQNMAKVHVTNAAEAESEFTISRLTNGRYYNDPRRSVVDDTLVLSFASTDNASNGMYDLFKITHTKTGLCAYIKITSQTADGFEIDDDGFLKIQSAADLYNISQEINSGSPEGVQLAQSAFKLYADIDMRYFDGTEAGRMFYAIGTDDTPFRGSFVGQTDQNGNNLYTISNVTVLASNDSHMQSYNGLFGVVDATVYNESQGDPGIENFNVENLRVVGGDTVGGLIARVYSDLLAGVNDAIPTFPIRGISMTDSVVIGGDSIDRSKGRRVGGLIGEIYSDSVEISAITMENVEVSTYYYNARFANQVTVKIEGVLSGYFSPDYFSDPVGIGGVVGVAWSKQQVDYPNELTITDTHVSNLSVGGRSSLEESAEQYVTMDAGGIIGAALNSYDPMNPETALTSLTIGDASTTADVTVTDSKIMSYGNAGGVIGASNVTTVLSNCVVSGSDDSAAPERSEMQVLSRSLYYLGGIAGYIGVSTYNISDASAIMSTNVIYASIVGCSVENAYVASTETSYMGVGSAPLRNVAVGGIIGGGNGQGYSWDYNDSVEAGGYLLPFVSDCTVDHSRIEGIITGGIVGADAEICYSFDDGTMANFRDLITNCAVTGSRITTVADATRLVGDCPDSASSDPVLPLTVDSFVLASGVGGIMGTNVRFHYDALTMGYDKSICDYAYLHDTIIQYCTVDSSTTVESLLPFTEAKTFCTVTVGGVIGTAFTNTRQNLYGETGRCMLRYNEINASVHNSANLSDTQDFNQNPSVETEVKVGSGGFIGAVKGGANQAQGQAEALCYVPGIHVYTSVFNGRLSGVRAVGGAIGVVNFASDSDYSNPWAAQPSDWTDYSGELPGGYMLYNLALAGSVALSGSAESYTSGNCCGGYVIGHISAGQSDAYTFSEYAPSAFFSDPTQIFYDITYTSFGSDSSFVPFGFLNSDMNVSSAPRLDDWITGTGCYFDVNLDENGDPRFEDMIKTYVNRYSEPYEIDVTEGSGESFVVIGTDAPAYNWRSSDTSVAAVETTVVNGQSGVKKSVKVRGLQDGTALISIPFVGYFSDGSGSGEWDSKEIFIPTGFKFETPVQAPLTTATNTSTGEVYYLVQTPYDVRSIGYNIPSPAANNLQSKTKSQQAMARQYAMYNEDGVIEFTDDMFAGDGSFPGGLEPVGNSTYKFTGSFETLPAGTYTVSATPITFVNNIPTFGTPTTSTLTVSYDPESADYVGFERMTLRNIKIKSAGSVGASLFGYVSGAKFRNFDIDGISLTGTTSGNHLGAIACEVFAPGTANTAPITIDHVNVNNFNFSDADYIGGLVGGIFTNSNNPSVNTAASVISNCVIGETDIRDIKDYSYANSISANLGAGGILAHSSQYAANITNCVVRDVDIEQEDDSFDTTQFDSGAAGVAMAYAGTVQNVTVEHCAITGEIVGGAVMRSYTSQLEDDFASAGRYGSYANTVSTTECYAASAVAINTVSVLDCDLVGTNDAYSTSVDAIAPCTASAGILARVDANTSNHTVTNCLVDENTTIKAVNGVGGIVGCVETPQTINYNTRWAQFGVTVTDCTMKADLARTATNENDTSVYNRGTGGVIGVFYRWSPLIFTKISGCDVGGTIHVANAEHGCAGGVVGAMYATGRTQTYFTRTQNGGPVPSFTDFANMASGEHFVSNCLVTTEFVKVISGSEVSVFNASSRGVGIVLGHYNMDTAATPMPILVVSTAGNYSGREPFYHVMFSTANYSDPCVALFGFDNASSHGQCLNGIENATAYCYDVNRAAADPDNESSHFSVSQDGYVNMPDADGQIARINTSPGNRNEAGMLELYSTSFNATNGYTVTFDWGTGAHENVLVLETDTTDENYSFGASSLPHEFSLSSNNGSVTKQRSSELDHIELANGTEYFDVAYPAGKSANDPGNEQAFTLTLKPNTDLNDKLTLTVHFVYANGLKMAFNVFINVRAREYWRLDPDVSGLSRTVFLVFNAADLAALQTELSTDSESRADACIIQCYDVFWTLSSDSPVVAAARAALKDENDDNLTIYQVLEDYMNNGIVIGQDMYGYDETLDLYSYLGSFVRPNPEYLTDPTQDPEITFSDYFSDYGSPENVPMAEIVGEISGIDYGVYGVPGSAAIIDPYEIENDSPVSVPFRGRYITLKNHLTQTDPQTYEDVPVSTGATEGGECYAIYGLDLRAENAVANTGSDAPYAGLIAQIGGGAVIDGVRFVNPKISVINSYETAACAGVLAGAVSYTDDDMGNSYAAPIVRNVSIEGEGDGSAYVKAIKRMNCASAAAGGLAGQIIGAPVIYNIDVSGIDVVSSYTANAQSGEESTILTGGIAGRAGSIGNAPTFRNVNVADCHVLGGHIANPVGAIRSYGGGMFGILCGSVDLLDSDPITGDPLQDPDTYEQLPSELSEVSGTVVGGSYISTNYGYDRDDQNNTALDIAGGVAAQSEGESAVKYVNVIDSTIVGGEIAGGIVGQVANKALDDYETTALSVSFSGVGMQLGYAPEDLYTLVLLSDEHPTNVLVVGTSGATNRFNTAGGVVGNVQNLDYLHIGSTNDGEEGVDFNGVVGTFGYDNHNREATAGGIIGTIAGSDEFGSTELAEYLDKIQIYASSVQGEVNGFNRESVTAMKCAGSAGGVIGKIACAARKADIDNGYYFITDCIMSAKVNLYNSVYGVAVDCANNQRNRNRNTNAGKIIGRVASGALIDANVDPLNVAEDLWQAIVEYSPDANLPFEVTINGYDSNVYDWTDVLRYALRGAVKDPRQGNQVYFANHQYCAISDYIDNVYGSSYPQDIVLYGSRDLCVIDFDHYTDNLGYMEGIRLPYFDCNRINRYVADVEDGNGGYYADTSVLPVQVQSFMVSEGNPDTGDLETSEQVYLDQQYIENAFIPLDDDPNAPTEHYKYFRFRNPAEGGSVTERKLVFRDDQIDIFDVYGEPVSGASATAAYDSDAVVMMEEVIKDNGNSAFYTYNVGVMTIDLQDKREMIGSLVLNFDYGIQMNSSFTSIEIEGDGSEQNPYLIRQPKHFIVMRALRSNGINDENYYKQMNNIDMNMTEDANFLNRYTSLEGFEPIGTQASPFYGNFDGNGYVIQNFYINDESTNAAGLFGCIGKGTELKNIHIEVADSLVIRTVDDERTVVNGGIIGGNNTGGLVGIVKATGSGENVTATVTNCSVAGGSVVGGMNVGGLIGASAGSVELGNCFTSTTTASYAGVSNVGALLGAVTSGDCTLDGCYTAGFAVAGSANPSDEAVGGLVGRNNSACTLEMTNCFVSATASGNTDSAVGLAVAANDGTISSGSTGNTVAALIPREDSDKTIYIIAPGFSSSGNNYESKMLGVLNDINLNNDDASTAIDYTNTSYADRNDYLTYIPAYSEDVYNGTASDAYSEAYRHLIAAAVKVDQSRQGYDGSTAINHVQSENIKGNGGLLYPLTMTFDKATVFTTSVYDLSDTVEYPMGIDLNLTGNGSNKNTDLLFKTSTVENSGSVTSSTVIYRNIFRNNETPVAVKYDGETYDNGEIYYDYNLPYAVANQTVSVDGSDIAIARKVMYPVVDIQDYGVGSDKIFPIATARQFKALTSTGEYGEGSAKFAFLRTTAPGYVNTLDYQLRDLILVADIDLATTAFEPLAAYGESFYGNGHVISNMQINSTGSAAMFTSLQSGFIYDLGLTGVNVTNTGSDSNTKAAMLVASMNQGTISNCFAIGTVKAVNAFSSGAAIGGLVGYAEGGSAQQKSVIENSLVSGSVIGYTGNGGSGTSAAGLLGRSSGSVSMENVTVTTNVNAKNTYAICGEGTNATVLNAVYGGQMTHDETVGGQYLIPAANVTAVDLYADDSIGLTITGPAMIIAPVLTAQTFAAPESGNFSATGMTSFGDGYYPVASAVNSIETEAFLAGARFAAAAIQLNYIGTTDAVSSVTAPSELGTYGTARLSADDRIGAYFANGDTADVIKVDPDSMRLTKKVGENNYVAADEVGGITGAVIYSMVSPVSNPYLVRTVDGVKVQKIFTLYYELTDPTGSTESAINTGDRTVITVENGSTSVTGLTEVSTDAGSAVTSGAICENVMIQPDQNGTYSMDTYCQPGSVGDQVNSAVVSPAYLANGAVTSGSGYATVSGNTSSFSGTSAAIGAAEDSGLRFSYLLVTVEIAPRDWGIQRTTGNWAYTPAN